MRRLFAPLLAALALLCPALVSAQSVDTARTRYDSTTTVDSIGRLCMRTERGMPCLPIVDSMTRVEQWWTVTIRRTDTLWRDPVPPVEPSTARTPLAQIIGPVLPLAETPAGNAARLDSMFVRYSAYPKGGDACGLDYYDAALHRYAWWARSGHAAWRDSARVSAVRYRRGYLEANAYKTTPHCSQIEGVAAHYWDTGDTLSRTAVIEVAKVLTNGFTPERMGDPAYWYTEGRIQARALLAALRACEMDSVTTYLRGSRRWTWCEMADRYADNAITLQRADGSYWWRISDSGVVPEVWGTSNFMLGLQNDALIKYYRTRRADPRILVALKKSADWLWTTQWDATVGAFQYWSTSPAATASQADVSQLIAGVYAFLWAQTGDVASRDRFDAIQTRTIGRAYYQGTKQFNQQFYDAFNAMAWRYGGRTP